MQRATLLLASYDVAWWKGWRVEAFVPAIPSTTARLSVRQHGQLSAAEGSVGAAVTERGGHSGPRVLPHDWWMNPGGSLWPSQSSTSRDFFHTGGGKISQGVYFVWQISYFKIVRNFPHFFGGLVRNLPRIFLGFFD